MVKGYLILAGLMVAIGLGWCGVVIVVMALALARPQRMSDARALVELHRLSPGDLGLEYEETHFQVVDESNGRKLRLAAWWLPNPEARGRCAVLVHGYSDAKVGAIAWAPLLRSMGWAILAIDLRAHGESGGKFCTAGFWERHDLNQVIDQFKATHPERTRQIMLFGISLGAAVVAAAAVDRHDLAAVILEGPFADFRSAAMYQAAILGLPGPTFQRGAIWIAQWLTRSDFATVRPLVTIPQIPCPLLVVTAGDDPFVSAEDQKALAAAVASRPANHNPSIYWDLQGVHHVLGLPHDPEQYRKRIGEFLVDALRNPAPMCES